ncbi:MAG: deoxyribodipyrimidine photo-lyase [Verrucomicrobiota bacterium]
MSDGTQCVWFKRDLRILDHVPLVRAAEHGPVLAIYMIEPEVTGAPDFDAMHWDFIRQSLNELRESLRELGTDLQVVRGVALEIFQALHEVHKIETIWAHEETGNAITYRRDQAVVNWSKSAGIRFEEIPQNGVLRRLKDRNGWARHWERRMSEPILPIPENLNSVENLKVCDIPKSADLGLELSSREVDLKGGETEALRVLESFVKGRGKRYHREMSSPNTAYESCSRISPYLAWGCISMRSVVQSVRAAAGESIPKVAARAFLSRCHWHCHFMQKLESEPEIEFRAFNRACDDLRCGELNVERLDAWKSGRTGYPFIDACIRSLRTRGWINFRMRAMLVSFASYHLWIDWRLFKDWLACQFIDYEPGIHISQVQMQSGLTGINTLRIYNPTKQGQDHDPNGDFIRRWVPELKDVATVDIHEPWKMPDLIQLEANCRIGEDYPLPIVDHKLAVKHARSQFAALRKRDDYWQSAQEVMERHGSRKSRESRNRPKRPKRKVSTQTEMDLDESQA